MKDKIKKAKEKYQSMAMSGIYNLEYMKDLKKQLITELKQENISRIGEFRVKWNQKVNKLKIKHEIKELSQEELRNYERRLRALPLDNLKEISGEGLSKNQIYAVGAELRNREAKASDHFMNMVKESNYLEPWKNDFNYKNLAKDDAAITIMEKDNNNYYEIGEENEPQQIKSIQKFDNILD